jgi:hypothetical protein
VKLKVTLAILLSALAFSAALASNADEQAIRKAYKVRDQCYLQKDAKKLATTEMPGYYAVTINGDGIPHAQIVEHLTWRFGSQVSCVRSEKPLSFKFGKDRAEVTVLISDVFVVADKKNVRTRNTRRESGVATWLKTPKGWKLDNLQFTKVEWIDAKGKWQTAKPRKS